MPFDEDTNRIDNPTQSNTIGLVITIVFFAIVFAIDIFAAPLHYEQWQTKNWDRTQGTVEKIYIWETCGDDGCSFRLEVDYSYEVDDTVYRSDQLSLVDWEDSSDSSLEWKENFERKHPKGSSIDVFVDPNDSDRSVLITGFSIGSGAFTNIAILSCFNLVAIFMVGARIAMRGTMLEGIGIHLEDPDEPPAEYSKEPDDEGPETTEEPSEEVGWWEGDDGAERGI